MRGYKKCFIGEKKTRFAFKTLVDWILMVFSIVKHLISAVSNFHGSVKMTYWHTLILVVMIYRGSRW